jgi:hypothetical protein
MKSQTQSNDFFKRMGWVVLGSASMLLILSAGGLELFAQQRLGQDNLTTVLLALYLASWSYVLGLVGLVLLSVWWLVEWVRVRAKQAAKIRYSPAEPRRRHLEQPELEDPQSLQQGVAAEVLSRSSRERGDGNEANRQTRVA